MGYFMTQESVDILFSKWAEEYTIFAPVRMPGKGAFSDTDSVRYAKISRLEEIEFDRKSDFSFKEVLLPFSETLFFFTEDQVKEADPPMKGAIVFLRSCDLHAVKRLEEIYLRSGFEDYYYARLREKVKFILMGCPESFENCFCVDMGTNIAGNYDAGLQKQEDGYAIDNRTAEWDSLMSGLSLKESDKKPSYVNENTVRVRIPEGLSIEVAKSGMWKEYDSRCIDCGRCNFVCPTCTCFSMQDIYYTDNGKAGERRRVTASCMVDGYTDVAGGGAWRRTNGERMRFKVLHKVYDFNKRFGYHMCVGCGRCDDACPEYISFSNCINKLEEAVREVSVDEK